MSRSFPLAPPRPLALSPSRPLAPALFFALLLTGSSAASNQGEKPAELPPTLAEKAPAPGVLQGLTEEQKKELENLLAERRRLDETTWAQELRAQVHEQAFVRLWDDLRRAEDKFAVLKEFRFERIILGEPGEGTTIDQGVVRYELKRPGRSLSRMDWQRFLDRMKEKGLRLVQSEWHHEAFDDGEKGGARSTFSVKLHWTAADAGRRYAISGDIHVLWEPESEAGALPVPRTIDATNLEILAHGILAPGGASRFVEVFAADLGREGDNFGPLIARDLDGDGRSEIVHPNTNRLYRNGGNGRFTQETFLRHPVSSMAAGVLADLNGDGRADFLCAGRGLGGAGGYRLFLYVGDADGLLMREPINPVPGRLALSWPQLITVGDIDGDGDLDVWLGQYKPPYLDGQMPTPFYDANDGFPAYLLTNDGSARFTDGTAGSGLERKRRRRTYAASFVDIDADDDLDLITVNDFAGVDVYSNDGSGRFADVTASAVDEKTNFGMALALADYNLDGELDFYVTGMSSTTVRRLNAMGLARSDFPEHQQMRSRMAYGNRMYLHSGPGTFRQPSFKGDVARSGWSWGAVALDFDNDGDRDIYVNNGNMSGRSATDYCTRYWCQDVYLGSSASDPVLNRLFFALHPFEIGRDLSWNGYEKNKLFMNLSGKSFVDVAFAPSPEKGRAPPQRRRAARIRAPSPCVRPPRRVRARIAR